MADIESKTTIDKPASKADANIQHQDPARERSDQHELRAKQDQQKTDAAKKLVENKTLPGLQIEDNKKNQKNEEKGFFESIVEKTSKAISGGFQTADNAISQTEVAVGKQLDQAEKNLDHNLRKNGMADPLVKAIDSVAHQSRKSVEDEYHTTKGLTKGVSRFVGEAASGLASIGAEVVDESLKPETIYSAMQPQSLCLYGPFGAAGQGARNVIARHTSDVISASGNVINHYNQVGWDKVAGDVGNSINAYGKKMASSDKETQADMFGHDIVPWILDGVVAVKGAAELKTMLKAAQEAKVTAKTATEIEKVQETGNAAGKVTEHTGFVQEPSEAAKAQHLEYGQYKKALKTAEGERSIQQKELLERVSKGDAGEQYVRSPIDPNASTAEKVEQIRKLSLENEKLVKDTAEDMHKLFGADMEEPKLWGFKAPEDIALKAQREEILLKKPWHDVEHIRDAIRFRTVVDNLDDVPEVLGELKRRGFQIIKPEPEKLSIPRDTRLRMAPFDLRAPNGQIVEYYILPKESLEAMDGGHHAIYKKWREIKVEDLSPEEKAARRKDILKMRQMGDDAWEKYLKRTGQTQEHVDATVKKIQEVVARPN